MMETSKTWNWVALTICGFAQGCADAEPNAAEYDRLAQSSRTWSELKGSSDRRYRYTSEAFSWTGHSSRTTLEVAGDAVISRAFEHFNAEGTTIESWTEDMASLGTNPRGAAPLTIDEIYERCGSDVLSRDPAKNWITLTFSENGVLQDCSYFPKTCADDCAVGYDISSLEFL